MRQSAFLDKTALIFATLFGIGYTPICPGSASCLAAVLLYLLIPSKLVFFSLTLVSTLCAFLVSGRAEKLLGEKDASPIVIDDFSGQLITFLFLPAAVYWLFIPAGFFLFRLLELLKIPPGD